jgi:hypothetical protein
MRTLVAQGAGKNVGAVAEFFGGPLNDKGALFRTIETVVDEKPLSFATSRIVTTIALPAFALL